MVDDDYVKGFDELIAVLKDLPGNLEKNALRTGTFRGAQFLRDKVQAAAPVSSGVPPKGGRMAQYTPGTLKASIKAKRRRGSKFEAAAGVTGVWYASLVEKGHTLKTHGKNGQIVGHVPANPFVFRTVEANRDQAVEIMRAGFAEGVERAFARLKKRMGG